jgi:serine O-acetyltransferase
LEVIFTYAGFHALIAYRLSHWLKSCGVPLLPRVISQVARWLTGIEIHPSARIGTGFFIDHGMGVVVGETAEIGDFVTLFQGVTLGGTGKERGKRHPTLGNHVVVGAGAKILGGITIGDNVKIGANSVVLKNVAANFTVICVPARVIKTQGERLREPRRFSSPLETLYSRPPVCPISLHLRNLLVKAFCLRATSAALSCGRGIVRCRSKLWVVVDAQEEKPLRGSRSASGRSVLRGEDLSQTFWRPLRVADLDKSADYRAYHMFEKTVCVGVNRKPVLSSCQ